jgi:hypothetical protein
MRIGLDFHGVIDRFPDEISILTKRWINLGHQIYIVTGESEITATVKVEALHVPYTHFFSIVDYHKGIGTPMELRDSGWWMDQETWDRTKGDYATVAGLHFHFEDTLKYAPWFPSSCTFVHVGSNFVSTLGVLKDFYDAFAFFNNPT